MELIEVKQNWPADLLRIGIVLGNYCNYKCWYCWPGSNNGTVKFPDVDLIKKNLSHLIDYYKEHTNKNKFDLILLGGEPTHWPKFIEFVSHFKKVYNCTITLKTNGSKNLDWWKQAAPYLDQVGISVHHEFVDLDHVIEIADYLYQQKMLVVAHVMMDPNVWDECMNIARYLLSSRYKWSIRYSELIDDSINYTKEQREVIEKVRLRGQNWLKFLRYNKNYVSKPIIVTSDKQKIKVSDNFILVNKLNNFYGWQCNLGVDWISISDTGGISGFCPNTPYNELTTYNLYDVKFVEKFQPIIAPVICSQAKCLCVFDTNMPKIKINDKKFIPIQNV